MCRFCEGQCSCHLNSPCSFCVSHITCERCKKVMCKEYAVEIKGRNSTLVCLDCAETIWKENRNGRVNTFCNDGAPRS